MVKARDMITYSQNKPESKYGATRAALLGKFYERVISEYLERMKSYKRMGEQENKEVWKPRIYWRDVQDVLKGDYTFPAQQDLQRLAKRMENSLNALKSHCTPDGLFVKRGKYYIWEAKNWVLWSEGGSKDPYKEITIMIGKKPWVLAKRCDFHGVKYPISGHLVSWWCKREEDKQRIKEAERAINSIIGEKRLEIILTDEILDDCIANQYPWYIEIIEWEWLNIEGLFRQLLGS